MYKLIFIVVFLLALSFAGIAIKILAKKNGKFSGTCSSQNPLLNTDGKPCPICGNSADKVAMCNQKQK